jgi:predicted RNA binding protein YcfA (HicA-like mRNA interferase family)
MKVSEVLKALKDDGWFQWPRKGVIVNLSTQASQEG